jgi:uncharacterized membrane protein
MMGGMNGIGMFVVGLLLVAMIALIGWGFRVLLQAQRNIPESDAQEILRHRFARGELSREEFEQARAALH